MKNPRTRKYMEEATVLSIYKTLTGVIDNRNKEARIHQQQFIDEMMKVTGGKGFIIVTNKKNGKYPRL